MSIEIVEIAPGARLDTITAYFHDMGPKQGRLVLVCWAHAWQALWSGLPEGKTVRQFVNMVDTGYLFDNLVRGTNITKRDADYLRRIIDRFHAELKS